jgi:seryl-tRNA synthetase
MIDPKLLQQDPNRVKEALLCRGCIFDVDAWGLLEEKRKALQTHTQTLAQQMGRLKAKGSQEGLSVLHEKAARVNASLDEQEKELLPLLEKQRALLLSLPNIAHASVPVGKGEDDNHEEYRVGVPPTFDFPILDHVTLGERSGGMDLEAARALSGARFSLLQGDLALLHRALAQFMLEVHTKEHGYTEVQGPLLVRQEALEGTGQWPKLAEDMFRIEGDSNLYLIPTSEVVLANLVADKIVEEQHLPLKWVSHTPCFRSEAGSYGKDTRGLFRLHQFEKVECVWVVKPEDSYAALEQLRRDVEVILQALELPYRVMSLCTGDMGISAAKTYDLEVWLPGQKAYREISSCSNTESFQARRMKARYRDTKSGKREYVHTLNGSGLAVGRTLIAVMENHQQKDGSVLVPEVLAPWMGGKKYIKKG